MKKIDLAQFIGVLANVGVVVGIVFLAIEIRQNTASLDSRMRFDQSEPVTEVFEELFRNDDLVQAIIAYIEGGPLTPLQELKLSAYTHRIFLSWQWLYGESARGATSVHFSEAFRKAFHSGPTLSIESSLYIDYWGRVDKSRLDPAFVEWMEENVVNER